MFKQTNILKYRSTPLTSVNTERPFPAYKLVFKEERCNFGTKNLEVVVYYSETRLY